MWLSFYNREAVGDTLMLTKGDIAVRQEQIGRASCRERV